MTQPPKFIETQKIPRVAPAPAKTAPGAASKKGGGWFRWLAWLIVLGALAGGLYYYFVIYAPAQSNTSTEASGTEHKSGRNQVPVVVTATATLGNMPIYLNGLGTVTPEKTATIKTRVSGQLMKINFAEGQFVKANDLLVQIDPRPYQVQLEQYQAQLLHDQALLQNAQLDQARYQKLWEQNSIPQQTLTAQQSLVLQDQGTVQSDQAQIDSVKLNLVYCNITAPFSGRVGLRLVDEGNYVQTSDAGIVVLTQIQPISVIFTLPEDSIPPVLAKLNTQQTLSAEAWDRALTTKLSTGTLVTVDNQIDPTTGTLRFRADFTNTDNSLFPNQFVNIKLLLETKEQAVLIPAVAIQTGQKGSYVYTLDENNVVSLKPVKVGATDGTNTEITNGLDAGASVVINGVDKLQVGMKVKAQAANATSAPSPDPSTASGEDPAAAGQHHHHHHNADGSTNSTNSSNATNAAPMQNLTPTMPPPSA